MTAVEQSPEAQPGSWRDEMARLKKHFPEWFWCFEDADAFETTRDVVLSLFASAPDEWSRGMVMGIDMCRVQVSSVNGFPYVSGAQPVSAEAVGSYQRELARLDAEAPDFKMMMDRLDVFTLGSEELQEVMLLAPNAWTRGLLMGIEQMRINVASMNGFAFYARRDR